MIPNPHSVFRAGGLRLSSSWAAFGLTGSAGANQDRADDRQSSQGRLLGCTLWPQRVHWDRCCWAIAVPCPAPHRRPAAWMDDPPASHRGGNGRVLARDATDLNGTFFLGGRQADRLRPPGLLECRGLDECRSRPLGRRVLCVGLQGVERRVRDSSMIPGSAVAGRSSVREPQVRRVRAGACASRRWPHAVVAT